MENKSLDDFTANDVSLLLYDAVDAVIVVDGTADTYKTIIRRGFFEKFLKEIKLYAGIKQVSNNQTEYNRL